MGRVAVTDGRDAILLEAAPPHDRQARSPTISDDAFPDPLTGHSPVSIDHPARTEVCMLNLARAKPAGGHPRLPSAGAGHRVTSGAKKRDLTRQRQEDRWRQGRQISPTDEQAPAYQVRALSACEDVRERSPQYFGIVGGRRRRDMRLLHSPGQTGKAF